MELLKKITELFVNEDEGYNDHMVGQTEGPFYCGTAFCGHSTKKAARECWKNKCDAIQKIREPIEKECAALREQGKYEEAERLYVFGASAQINKFYPERDPANWPCNRSSADMQREYIERAKRESEK